MNRQTISIGGFSHCYLEGGEGGSPLMLVHGFTGSKEDFVAEIEPLAAMGYHVVVPELLGHGESEHTEDESHYSSKLYAERLIELADKLGFERFDLLGHSMGGMIAQVLVLENSQRVNRLILMDTHHGKLTNVDPEIAKLGVVIAREQGLKVVQELLAMASDPLDNPAYQRLCDEDPSYREWAEGKMLNSSQFMYAAMLGEFPEMDDRLDALSEIETETLVLVGELDRDFIAPSKALAAAMPKALLEVIPQGGHSPQFEATEHWRKVVHGFLGPKARK